jgi:diguanylate cyclase (GGDEF)-like protein
LPKIKKPSQVHWRTGQFCEHGREWLYRRAITPRVRLESRLALVLVAAIFSMFAISDYYYLGPTREFELLVTLRAVVVCSCLVLAFAIGRWGSYASKVWLHALPLWVLSTGIILIVPLRPETLSTQVVAVVVAIMAFYLLIPNLLTVVTVASLYLSIGFLTAAIVTAEISPVVALRMALLLIMTNIVGFFALLRIESLQRIQFGLIHEERHRNRQLLKEVAHRKMLEAQLRGLAERDALTGLNNRGHFMEWAHELLQRSRVEGAPFSLFMLDVDHFKAINDTWGHSHGDWALSEIARVCQQSVRPQDVVGRFGGEEFIVALPNTRLDDARIVAERLRKKVAELMVRDEMCDLNLSVTIGIAEAHAEETELEPLIKRADKVLYVGKNEGRNRVVVCCEGIEER